MNANEIALIRALGGKKSNLPFFGETTGTVEVLGETELTMLVDSGLSIGEYPTDISVTANETYTVVVDGVEYSCVANDMGEAVTLGNLAIAGAGTDTGEPFVLLVYAGQGMQIYKNDGSTSVTLSITQEQTVITPLPVKYLPEGVPWVEEGVMVEVLAECQPTYDEDEGVFAISENVPTLEVGITYIVNWNGTEYTCVGQDLSGLEAGAVGIGDCSLWAEVDAALTGNGEPFLGAVLSGTMIFMPLDGTTDPTISIKGNGAAIHKLDNRCLPDGIPSLFNVNVTVNNDVISSIDKTFAEIYAAAMNSSTIVRMLATVDDGETVFFSLVNVTSASAVFGVAYYAGSSGVFMTITVNSDDTTSFVYGS